MYIHTCLSICTDVHILCGMTPVEIRLRELREAAGLTQSRLAEKAGLDQGHVSRIESGRASIGLDVLDRLCRALKCEPGDILVRKRGK